MLAQLCLSSVDQSGLRVTLMNAAIGRMRDHLSLYIALPLCHSLNMTDVLLLAESILH